MVHSLCLRLSLSATAVPLFQRRWQWQWTAARNRCNALSDSQGSPALRLHPLLCLSLGIYCPSAATAVVPLSCFVLTILLCGTSALPLHSAPTLSAGGCANATQVVLASYISSRGGNFERVAFFPVLAHQAGGLPSSETSRPARASRQHPYEWEGPSIFKERTASLFLLLLLPPPLLSWANEITAAATA